MKRKHKKSTNALDVRAIVVNAIVDLLVGLILLLVDKLT